MSTMNTAVRYLSLHEPPPHYAIPRTYPPHRFLMAQTAVAYIVSLTWVMNTFFFSQTQSKRAAAIALTNSTGTSGFISFSSVVADELDSFFLENQLSPDVSQAVNHDLSAKALAQVVVAVDAG
ncbi:hypothetical protein EDD22DRAFT_949288 [Suillus occidentalis]|nr:hypothetical protein EDD22DRAFT_949288 [Suillus occidentalis]